MSRKFDWNKATDAERLAWARHELVQTEPELAAARATLDMAAQCTRAAQQREQAALDTVYKLSETCAGLRGNIRHLENGGTFDHPEVPRG